MPTTVDLLPVAVVSNGWSLIAGTTKVAACNSDDGATSYVEVARSDVAKLSFTLTGSRPEMASVISVVAYFQARTTNNPDATQPLSFFARLGTVDGAVTAVAVPGSDFLGAQITGAITKPGGGIWTPADVQDPTLELAFYVALWNAVNPGNVAVTLSKVRVTYEPVPEQIGSAREVGSRILLERRSLRAYFEVKVPLALALDLEVGDLLPTTHFAIPDASGAMANNEIKRWQRLPFEVLRADLPDQFGMSGNLLVRDLRPFMCTFWDVAWSKNTAGPTADGIARWDQGNTRTYTRPGKAWVVNPPDGLLVELIDDQEKHDQAGDLHEEGSTNRIIQSGFKNGSGTTFTGWSFSGSGTQSEETADLPWDSTIVARVLRMAAGNPITTDFQAQATATASVTANTIGSLGLLHKDVSGVAGFWALQRGFDSNWWRHSDRTWQAAKTWNSLPVRAAWSRDFVTRINVGANATTLTLFVGAPSSGGTVGQNNLWGHVQWEDLPTPTSIILTETVTVTRNADAMSHSNNSGLRLWPDGPVTFDVTAIPSWDAADVTAGIKTIFYVDHGGGDSELLKYDGAAARWEYVIVEGGATYRAFKAHSPVRGTPVRISVRRTSGEGELNLPNYTASLFVDGVKGTDVTSVAVVPQTTEIFYRGHQNLSWFFDGHLRLWRIMQRCAPDHEIARGF